MQNSRFKIGKILISIAIFLSALLSTLIDVMPGDQAHAESDFWAPHSVFHDAAMFLLLDFMAIVCIWLIWRKSLEPMLGLKVGTLLVFAFWSPFYYITSIFPKASLLNFIVGKPGNYIPLKMDNLDQWPKEAIEMTPFISGFPIYINVALGTMLMIIALVGYLLSKNAYKSIPIKKF